MVDSMLQTESLLQSLMPGAKSFNVFLQQLQKHWANRLAHYESRASWQIERRSQARHDSLIYQIRDGQFLEKGGINYSMIKGDALPVQATANNNPNLSGKAFVAMGISMILHPKNPYVPTVHTNLRYFQTLCDQPIWWFAGVMDLTPFYGFDEDCIHWHQTCKKACSSVPVEDYLVYKKACDDYYYLPHRKEHRGIGGLWIEHHNQGDFSDCQNLIESLGNHFLPAYEPIVKRRTSMPYSQNHRDFQQLRRNRYVEFNLLYDRGTKFGLSLGSRSESILISMPPTVTWPYNWQPSSGSEEEKLVRYYLQPQAWGCV